MLPRSTFVINKIIGSMVIHITNFTWMRISFFITSCKMFHRK